MNISRETKINIAIDGPAGAGKSTVARLIANALGYVYVDTGAMYRVITWKSIQSGVEPHKTDDIVELTRRINIQLIPGATGQQVLADEQDVTEAIRMSDVNNLVSEISQIKRVRDILTNKQQAMAASKGVVMDGRDIGTEVLPDAELKIFLTAAVKERAERRYRELQHQGVEVNLEQIKHDIALRDHKDEQREISPLVQAEDAILLDCTNMSVTQVVEHILELSRSMMDGAN